MRPGCLKGSSVSRECSSVAGVLTAGSMESELLAGLLLLCCPLLATSSICFLKLYLGDCTLLSPMKLIHLSSSYIPPNPAFAGGVANPEDIDLGDEDDAGGEEGGEEDGVQLEQRAVPDSVFGSLADKFKKQRTGGGQEDT